MRKAFFVAVASLAGALPDIAHADWVICQPENGGACIVREESCPVGEWRRGYRYETFPLACQKATTDDEPKTHCPGMKPSNC